MTVGEVMELTQKKLIETGLYYMKVSDKWNDGLVLKIDLVSDSEYSSEEKLEAYAINNSRNEIQDVSIAVEYLN